MPLKDHEIAQAVSELTQIAKDFHATQQLRERIRYVVLPLLERAQSTEQPTEQAVSAEDLANMVHSVGGMILEPNTLDNQPEREISLTVKQLRTLMSAPKPAQQAVAPAVSLDQANAGFAELNKHNDELIAENLRLQEAETIDPIQYYATKVNNRTLKMRIAVQDEEVELWRRLAKDRFIDIERLQATQEDQNHITAIEAQNERFADDIVRLTAELETAHIAGFNEAKEAAAKVCEDHDRHNSYGAGEGFKSHVDTLEAIRALTPQGDKT